MSAPTDNTTTPPPTADEIAAARATLHRAGDAIRRSVAGPQHVDAVQARTTAFGQPMQELATTAAWGLVWTRPGLSRKQRSLLNVAMLCALNRGPELGVHVRGAFRNGATEAEVRETVLQASVYCGMPAGMEGFRIAERVLNEVRAEGMVVEKGE